MAKHLHKGDESRRRWNIIKASCAGDAAMLPQLLARLNANETHANRRHIVRALGKIGGHEAEAKLLQLLQSEDGPLMLGDIAHSLGQLRSQKAVPLLKQLSRHSEPWVQQNVTYALRRIKGEA